MFGTLNDVTPSLMPNVQHYKRTPSTIARKKSFQGEHNGAFLLFVMLVIGVLPKVWQSNYTSFGFVMMIEAIVLEASGESMQMEGRLCFLYGLCKKE
jgi:hypothetical protein